MYKKSICYRFSENYRGSKDDFEEETEEFTCENENYTFSDYLNDNNLKFIKDNDVYRILYANSDKFTGDAFLFVSENFYRDNYYNN